MAKEFPSQEWFDELQTRLNNDEQYQQEASGYGVDFNGDYIFTIEPGDGLDETRHFFVGLEDGKCTDVYEVENPDEADSGFIFSGPYQNWKKLVENEIGAIEGLMSGEFELEGSMNTILQYQDAATTLVETCAEIDTEYVG